MSWDDALGLANLAAMIGWASLVLLPRLRLLLDGLRWSSLSRALSRSALGRYGKPEEIAAAVALLASPDAAFITGATLDVDGGFSAGAVRRAHQSAAVKTEGFALWVNRCLPGMLES